MAPKAEWNVRRLNSIEKFTCLLRIVRAIHKLRDLARVNIKVIAHDINYTK